MNTLAGYMIIFCCLQRNIPDHVKPQFKYLPIETLSFANFSKCVFNCGITNSIDNSHVEFLVKTLGKLDTRFPKMSNSTFCNCQN